MNNNIKKLQNFKCVPQNDSFVCKLFNKVMNLNVDKLLLLIVGSSEKTLNLVNEKEKENQLMVNRDQNMIYDENVEFKPFPFNNFYEIQHLNCKLCLSISSVKLFNNDIYKINNKQIYISYNLLTTLPEAHYMSLDDERPIFKEHYFFYVEFNNIILIDAVNICMASYFNKLPVYNYLGKLILPHMQNLNNKVNPFVLDIDPNFTHMLGLPIISNDRIRVADSEKIVNSINHNALIILRYHLYFNKDSSLYNISEQLANKLYSTVHTLFNPVDDNSKHNTKPKNSLLNVFYRNTNTLRLNNSGYATRPPRLYTQLLEICRPRSLIITDIYSLNKALLADDNHKKLQPYLRQYYKYKYKYIKYKKKYLHLKLIKF